MQGALLNYLRENSGRVLTRQELASAVWGLRLDARSRVVDQTVSQVRKKLQPEERIVTIHGIGYRHSQQTTGWPTIWKM